jgi:hypothetical protein
MHQGTQKQKVRRNSRLLMMQLRFRRLIPDTTHYSNKDNSVSVGIKIDFALWERSSEFERLGLLADNIRRSLDKIQSRYLVEEDREKLRLIVDKVQALLVSRLQ